MKKRDKYSSTAITHAVALIAAMELAGCSLQSAYTAGATLSLPQAATLQPGEAVHLLLRLEVIVDGGVFSVEHKWHCDHERHFSMGDGKWHLQYVPSQTRFVRRINLENALFVGLPDCPGGTAAHVDSRPDLRVLLIKTPDDPEVALQVKNDVMLHGTKYPRVKYVEVTRSSPQIADSLATQEETELLNRLKAFNYQSVYGTRFMREDWGRSPALRGTLEQFDNVTIAPPDKRHFAVSEFSGFSDLRSLRPRSDYVSFKFDGDAWVIDEISPYHHVQVYRRAAPRTKGLLQGSPFVVKYKDVRTGTLERTQQIYDPSNGWLIVVGTVGFIF